MPRTVEKICVICGKDVSAAKRTKDAAGRYYCNDCYAKVSAAAPVEKSSEPLPGTPKPFDAANPATRVKDFLNGDDYDRSPVLQFLRRASAKMGWNPSQKQGQAHLMKWAKWIVMAMCVVIALLVFAFGTRLISAPSGKPDGMVLLPLLIGFFCVLGFIPASLGLIFRLLSFAFTAKGTGAKVISAVGVLLLIGGLIFGWPKIAEMWALIGVKKPDIAYTDLDSRFGFGTMNKPSQFGKTSEQLKEESAGLLNTGVSWKGVISDVRDGQILVEMRQTSMSNEVVLLPGWWDEWRVSTLNRGDLIEFDGVLAGFGDPYPYAITHGTIRAARSAPADQIRGLLPE